MDHPIPGHLTRMIEGLRSFVHEAAQAASEESLNARVMELFRAENLEGLSALMAEQRMVAEFRDELHTFADRWTVRLYGRDRTSPPAIDGAGGDAR